MSDNMTPARRRTLMSSIGQRDTKPELVVRRMLFQAGYRYRLNTKTLPGTPDICLPSRRIAIFVNGCFWHAHKNCKYYRVPKSNRNYWKKKLRKNAVRDNRNVRDLLAMGWKVITVWECATRTNEDSRAFSKCLTSAMEGGAVHTSIPKKVRGI